MTNRTFKGAVGALALAGLVVAGGCGKDDKPSGVETGKAPSAGKPSPTFKVPLPSGAEAEPASADPGGEAYRMPSKQTLLDVNAFYEGATDGKPLEGFAWCGAAGMTQDEIVRIWKKTEANQLKVNLVRSDKGVLIKITEDKAAPATTCPPGPTKKEQPFESGNP